MRRLWFVLWRAVVLATGAHIAWSVLLSPPVLVTHMGWPLGVLTAVTTALGLTWWAPRLPPAPGDPAPVVLTFTCPGCDTWVLGEAEDAGEDTLCFLVSCRRCRVQYTTDMPRECLNGPNLLVNVTLRRLPRRRLWRIT